jgi:hypothetical protein
VNLDRTQVDPILHHTFRSIPQVVEKLTRYAVTGNPLQSAGLDDSDLLLPRILFRHIVLARAWRDGRPGIHAASLSALHDYIASLRKWECSGSQIGPVGQRTRRFLAILSSSVRLLQRARSVARQGLGK